MKKGRKEYTGLEIDFALEDFIKYNKDRSFDNKLGKGEITKLTWNVMENKAIINCWVEP